MKPNHHLDDATLMAYSAGAVPEGFSLLIAAHLELCERCRDRAAEAEALGGRLLDRISCQAVGAGSLAQLWDRIDALPDDEPPAALPVRRRDGLPSVLSPYLPERLEDAKWRPLVPGIRQHILKPVNCGHGSVRLFSIAPGTTIPHHGHGGSELTLVLRGSFVDEIGRFQAGDIADLDTTVTHQPVADTDEACICLIATDEKLRFSDVMSRVLQPLIGL